MNKCKKTVIAIFLFGLCLRLIMIAIPYTEDERKNILVTEFISFDPDNLNLPMESKYVTHPLLNLYVTKVGVSIFGDNKFGVRFFHVILGSLAILMVYKVARYFGEEEAMIAMYLMTCNQFLIHGAIRAENSSMLYLFASLSMLLFLKAMEHQKAKYMLCLGPVLGLAYLVKGVFLLLILSFGIYLLVTPKQRIWFRRKSTWIAVGLFLLIISPWIFWVRTYGTSQLIFDNRMYTHMSFVPIRTAVNLYLLEPIAWLQGLDYRMQISWEYGILDGITGMTLFGCVLWAMRKYRGDVYRFMYIIFLVFMVVLSFFRLPGLRWGEFWWPGISLIPAFCLSGVVCKRGLYRRGWPHFLVMAFLVYSFFNAGRFVATAFEEFKYPPHRFSTFVDDDHISARIYDDQLKIDEAIEELQKLLTESPNNVENLNYLGWLYWGTKKFDDAMLLWMRALELEPDYQSVLNKFYIFSHHRIFDLQELVDENPEDEAARLMLGKLYYHADDFLNSVAELNAVLKADPFQKEAYYYRGLCHVNQKRFGPAARDFEKILEIDSYHWRAYYQLGMIYRFQKKFDKAVKSFQKAIEVNPDDAKSMYELAQIYELQDKLWMARKVMKQAKQVYHDDTKLKVYPNMLGRYKNLFKPE